MPWVGFPLADLLKRFEPAVNAKFVEFVTVKRPEEMPAQRARFMSLLPWPYIEGLRIDEALHPLALMAVGLYGEELPNQNGAPLRLVVPWKYGFKSIKSIVTIRFVEKQPVTTWMRQAPEYYGFYSNVNPARPTRRSATREPNGVSANSSCARRCRSTATPTRSPRSTPGWTCVNSTSGA